MVQLLFHLQKGLTALDAAIAGGHLEVQQQLLKHNAVKGLLVEHSEVCVHNNGSLH